MTGKVQNKTVITFIDGTTIEAQPLKISLLKPFMRKFGELVAVADDNEKSMDVLLDCVQITMQQYKPDLAENREALEENIDLPTVYQIIDIASGIQMADPTTVVNAIIK